MEDAKTDSESDAVDGPGFEAGGAFVASGGAADLLTCRLTGNDSERKTWSLHSAVQMRVETRGEAFFVCLGPDISPSSTQIFCSESNTTTVDGAQYSTPRWGFYHYQILLLFSNKLVFNAHIRPLIAGFIRLLYGLQMDTNRITLQSARR